MKQVYVKIINSSRRFSFRGVDYVTFTNNIVPIMDSDLIFRIFIWYTFSLNIPNVVHEKYLFIITKLTDDIAHSNGHQFTEISRHCINK